MKLPLQHLFWQHFCGIGAIGVVACALVSCQMTPAISAIEPELKSKPTAAANSNAVAASSSLQSIEALYTDTLPWLLRLYDHDSGGFYESLATRAQPGAGTDLQSLQQALSLLKSSDLLDAMPTPLKKKMVEHVQSRQNARTGYFSDPAYPQMEREERVMARALSYATASLDELGAAPLHPLPGAANGDLPARFASTKALKQWLDELTWHQPWRALDAVSSQKSVLKLLPPDKQKPLVAFIYDYVRAKQDPQTGMVGGGDAITRISGMAKFGWFCLDFGLPLPRAEADTAFVLDWYRSHPEVQSLTMVRNPLHHLADLQPFLPQPMSEADKALVVRESARLLASFRQRDGAFSMQKREFPLRPNDISPPIGQSIEPQSDLNGTSQARTIREKCYGLLGIAPDQIPPLRASDTFWQALQKPPV